MPKLLTPADLTERAKAGASPRDVFYDAAGTRIAKAVGISAQVAAADDGSDQAVEFIISTGALDRYNSTIAVKGWQTDNFTKNPVVLWAHDDSIPAIARAENVRVDGGNLKSRAVFATRDVHPLADTIRQLIKGKFIGAASVGWIPLKWQYVEEEGRGFGVDYLEQELLEWSVVNIPANPECLVGARSLGIDTSPIMVWAARALDLGGMSVIPRTELEVLRKAAGAPEVFQVPKFLGHRQAPQRRDDSADWKCGAARDLPIVEEDGWDGPATEKAIFSACGFDGDEPDTAKARKAFLACDESAPKKRESYKLPFAKLVDGELKASSAGIKAAASRLPDTDIPQAVKDEGRKVLDAYESKMGDGKDKKDDALRAGVRAAVMVAVAGGIKNAASLETAVDVVLQLFSEKRKGRVISKANEERLRAAHDHCMRASAHVQSLIDQCNPDDDDDGQGGDGDNGGDDGGEGGDGTTDDPEQAHMRETQRQRAAVLKLRGTEAVPAA